MESCVSVKMEEVVFKDYRERIMNEENDWDHNVEVDAVECSVDCASREDMVQALNEMKT